MKKRDLFIETYRVHADAIYRHCFFRLFVKARAEELMQDAFLKLWEYIQNGHEVKNMRALLYRIADHLIIDEKRKHTMDSLDRLAEEEGFDPAGASELTAEHQVLYRQVTDELQTLSEEERHLFTMRYLDDLDPKEIAEITDTTANTVSVQLNRITHKLKDKINS